MVELHPMLSGGDASGAAEPDPARPIVTARAIGVNVGASVIGEAGTAHGFGGDTRLLSQDVWISIQEDEMGNIADWKQHDRV
jgi:hypothetical protein